MENFYSSKIHGFPNYTSLSNGEFSQESVLSLIAVLGSSISLVGLVFAFITYRYLLNEVYVQVLKMY